MPIFFPKNPAHQHARQKSIFQEKTARHMFKLKDTAAKRKPYADVKESRPEHLWKQHFDVVLECAAQCNYNQR